MTEVARWVTIRGKRVPITPPRGRTPAALVEGEEGEPTGIEIRQEDLGDGGTRYTAVDEQGRPLVGLTVKLVPVEVAGHSVYERQPSLSVPEVSDAPPEDIDRLISALQRLRSMAFKVTRQALIETPEGLKPLVEGTYDRMEHYGRYGMGRASSPTDRQSVLNALRRAVKRGSEYRVRGPQGEVFIEFDPYDKTYSVRHGAERQWFQSPEEALRAAEQLVGIEHGEVAHAYRRHRAKKRRNK